MHTTEQAKALWCPMVRIARREHCHPADDEGNTSIASGCNTDALGGTRVPASCRCIADQCAMWRWAAASRQPRQIAAMNARAIVESDAGHEPAGDCTFSPAEVQRGFFVPACWVETQASVDATRLGYCGLAGSPTI